MNARRWLAHVSLNASANSKELARRLIGAAEREGLKVRRYSQAAPWWPQNLAESSSRRDSIRIETAVRTEYVPDTVFIEIPVESERVTVRDTASHLETSFAVSDARLNTDGSLYHSLRNKPQKRPFEIKTEVVYRDSVVYRDRTEAETRTVEVERELTRWQRMQMRGFWIALLVLAVVSREKVLSAFRLFA